jgi:hypothetical protein
MSIGEIEKKPKEAPALTANIRDKIKDIYKQI